MMAGRSGIAFGTANARGSTTNELRVDALKAMALAPGTATRKLLATIQPMKGAMARGTDTLFDANAAARQGEQLTKLTRWYKPAEVLKMATGDNGQLLALPRLQSPYEGKLGVVQEGV